MKVHAKLDQNDLHNLWRRRLSEEAATALFVLAAFAGIIMLGRWIEWLYVVSRLAG